MISTVFVFPGQGSHHPGMGRNLIARRPDLVTTDFRTPRLPVVSSVTGGRITSATEAVVALRSQLTSLVRWTEAVERLGHCGARDFVEVGPGRVLGGLVRRIAPTARVHATDTVERQDLTVRSLTRGLVAP